MADFAQFGISKAILDALADMGFEEPSPIQAACIPLVLDGRDVIGQAQTGTGKTAAFGIPIVERVTPVPRVQAIVLAPTRELAIQVAEEIGKIAKYKRGVRALPIYGGQSIEHQIRAMRKGVQIVIGTPGRVLDHLRRRTLRLDDVRFFVLDEADEMLDMGFIDDIEAILRLVPKDRQTLLFSATMPPEIRRLAFQYMNRPEVVAISRGSVAAPTVTQVYYRALESQKLDVLCRILDAEDVERGILFCRTKKGAAELAQALQARGYSADALHGDLNQSQRNKVMDAFRSGELELLVATDVAARGIDVENVTHVINYDIPQDPESYVHRIGRTGRAGKTGMAITLVTPREMKQLQHIERTVKVSIEPRDVPTVSELGDRQIQYWTAQLTAQLDKKDLDLYRAFVQQWADDGGDVVDLAAAALKLAFGPGDAEGEEYNFGDTGARDGMVRFFLNVGRSAGLGPREVAEVIAEQAGIPARTIGRIDLFDSFAFVEVPTEVAPFVYEALRNARINGRRVNVEPAKPRAARENGNKAAKKGKRNQTPVS
ncbi:DEAD/DEAH box helicase [Calditerricola yamamurae]|nr:RNA helicase [Bacillota bacterium]